MSVSQNFFSGVKHGIKNSVTSIKRLAERVQMPHRGILVLAALAISVIGVSLTYRIKEARMEAMSMQDAYSKNIAAEAGTSNQVLAADERVAAALAETQGDILGNLASSSNPFEPNPKDNISDRFTKDIVAAYSQFEYSKTGDFNLDNASTGALNNIDVNTLPKPQYTLNNLKVYVPKNKGEIKVYGNTFAKTYLTALVPVVANPTAYNTDLNAVGDIYKNVAAGLMKMSVPAELAVTHLKVANNFAVMADTFPIINGQEKDPVRALLGLKIMQETMTEVPTLFIKINKYFKDNGIIFETTEPGSIWNSVPATIPASAAPSTT